MFFCELPDNQFNFNFLYCLGLIDVFSANEIFACVLLGLKSYEWFLHWTSAQREFNCNHKTVWFHTKIAQHEVQLSLYYIHFDTPKFNPSNTRLFSMYKYLSGPILSWFVNSCKSCLSLSSSLSGYFKQALKSDLLLCFSRGSTWGKDDI